MQRFLWKFREATTANNVGSSLCEHRRDSLPRPSPLARTHNFNARVQCVVVSDSVRDFQTMLGEAKENERKRKKTVEAVERYLNNKRAARSRLLSNRIQRMTDRSSLPTRAHTHDEVHWKETTVGSPGGNYQIPRPRNPRPPPLPIPYSTVARAPVPPAAGPASARACLTPLADLNMSYHTKQVKSGGRERA